MIGVNFGELLVQGFNGAQKTPEFQLINFFDISFFYWLVEVILRADLEASKRLTTSTRSLTKSQRAAN